MPEFRATDGTVFTDRTQWRKYEMETQYTFRDRKGEHELKKEPGSINGQPFDLADLEECTVMLLDHSDMVQVDALVNCKVFVAASCEAVFVRECRDCEITLACKQLRTRDCTNCTFHLYSKTEPIIETSSGMRVAE